MQMHLLLNDNKQMNKQLNEREVKKKHSHTMSCWMASLKP